MNKNDQQSHSGSLIAFGAMKASSNRAGFALVTVLFTLAIITALMSVTTIMSLNHTRQMASERTLIMSAYQDAELADLAAAWRQAPDNTLKVFSVGFGDEQRIVRFESVSALIDLNTAVPVLVEALLTTEDHDEDAISAYRTWRRNGWRLQRVSDLTRITGLSPETVEKYQAISTVFSGRTGLAISGIPVALQDFITTSEVLSQYDVNIWPEELTSPASGANFNLAYTDSVTGSDVFFASISVTDKPRVLALR